MPTFTGQIAHSQVSLIELGGPRVSTAPTPPVLAKTALPYIAHLYANDWTFKAVLGPLANRPTLKQTINAGFQPITLLLTDRSLLGTLYGEATYGAFTYGGLAPGDIIALTEQGGDGSVVYSGLVEDTPDVIAPNGVTHSISLTPFVAELGDARLDHTYAAPTEVAQMVRDAVQRTNHCSFTPDSIPDTGIKSTFAFNNASALDVLNTARRLTGPNYFWFVDAVGMVWFQAVSSSSALYTVKVGVDGNSRTASNSISQLKNKIKVLGGVPPGGSAIVSAEYSNASSQSQFGVRAWDPPLSYPTITDSSILQTIANTVGTVYDRVSHSVTVGLPAYGQRILLGWPGGASMRLWEPNKNSLVQSEAGSGGYSANFAVLDVETDGPHQKVSIGDWPVNSIQELDGEINRAVQRTVLQSLVSAPASLNTPGTFTAANTLGTGGTFQTAPTGARTVYDGTGLHMYDANNLQRLFLDPASGGIHLYDVSGEQRIFIDALNSILSVYDQAGVARAQMGHLLANGISPDQFGFRVVGGSNNPIMDSLGLIGVMQILGAVAGAPQQNITSLSNTAITGASVTFTVPRQSTVLSLFLVNASCDFVGSNYGGIGVTMDGSYTGPSWPGGDMQHYFVFNGTQLDNCFGMRFDTVAAGSHTVALTGVTYNSAGATLFIARQQIVVFQLGG